MNDKDFVIDRNTSYGSIEEKKERIQECVNAMQGIKDPIKFMEAVKKAIKYIEVVAGPHGLRILDEIKEARK